MATSSILANFVIKGPEAVDNFIKAYEAASAQPEWQPSTKEPMQHLENPEDIRRLFQKRGVAGSE